MISSASLVRSGLGNCIIKIFSGYSTDAIASIVFLASDSKKSRFSPIWEQDKKLDVDRFYSLSDAERMILEVATLREISPSDDELQARLEVGRPRLSQLYNSLHKSGMLSVRKQGRTRLFKLSEAAANEF